ncbi:MAG: ATP-binding cassette domain-containing protein [Eggerthellales bacterium]|nr:ATP-binding cassette domain-containing protein [Eggerthellales bacterium]
MLIVQDVSFSYPAGPKVLHQVSLEVAPGKRVALRAPSGFGKTTLCQIMAGYVKPSQGQVLVDGERLPRRGVCPVQMIWQHPERVLDPRMRMGRALAQAGAVDERVMDELGIRREWMDRFPHELSGGELQRFCIARALGANPRYLIADEISTMLDALTQAQLWRFLRDEAERRGLGMVVVSHSPALLEQVATRVVDLV